MSVTPKSAAKKSVSVLPGLLFIALAFTSVRAQGPTDNGTPLGLAPGSPEGAYALSGFENVNLYSGSLSFSFPVLQMGGRGSAGYAAQVPIDTKWMVQKNEWYDENENLMSSLTPWANPLYGGSYGPGTVGVRYSQWKPEGCYIGAQQFTTFRWASVSVIFTAPDGTEHELVDQATLGSPTSYPSCSLNGTFRGPVFVSRDQPGMTFIADAAIREAPYWANGRITGYLKMPDGTVYRVDAIDHNYQWGSWSTLVISWIRDANGNKTTFNYASTEYGDRLTSVKDSLNRVITVEYGVTEGVYGLCDRLTYKGFGGANRVIHISYGAMSTALRSGSSIQTYHQLFPELDGAEDQFNPSVTTAIWLPDGDGITRKFRFLYNSFGELARIELPTGGAIEYDWGSGLANGASDGLVYPVPGLAHPTEQDLSVPQIYRRLVTRRAYDVGNVLLGSTGYSKPETQNYDHTINNVGYVTSSHFDSNSQQLSTEKHFFYGSVAASFFSWQATPQYMPTYSPYASYRDGREYQTDYLAANGQTLLRRETQSWDQRTLNWWYGSANAAPPNCPFVKENVATLGDTGQVTKSTNIHPQTGQIMIDGFGNPTDVWIYDYGSGNPGGLLRHMHTEFMTVNPINGIDYTNRTSVSGPHILSLPTRMSIYDAGETERARTTIEYDNYSTATGHAALIDRSSISGFDPSFSIYYSTRGNSTATTRYFLTNGSVTGSISGYVQYDIAGNTVKTIDARGNATVFGFSDSFGAPDGNARLNAGPTELSSVGQYSYAFTTAATNAMNQTTYTQFDYYLAKVVDREDTNGTTYSGYYEDVLDRATKLIDGANRDSSLKRQTNITYDDPGHSMTQTNDFNSFNEANPLKTQSFYDGLGRPTESRQFEAGSNYIAVKQRYDSFGRANQVSNPFRNGQTPVWSITTYDELSRVTSVTTPDNAVALNSYSGNSGTATDQTGKKRKSVSDALGRLTQVYEDPNGVNWATNYTYDAVDNLTVVSQYDPVSQVTQTRTFNYDSLKRLTSAVNPENGTVNYVYDEQGSVLVQTDARGVSKHLSYDVLNRTTRRWYNGSTSTTATVNNSPALPAGVGTTDETTFVYDSQNLPGGAPPSFSRGYSTGRLVAVNYGTTSAGDYFSYDAIGRAVLKVQQTGGVNYQMTVNYNNGGARTSATYPSGHVVNYNYDQAGRLGDKDAQNLAMTGNLGDGVTRTYATAMTYSELGGLQQEQFGTVTPLYHKLHYNIRGQLNDIRLSSVSWSTDQWNWNRGLIAHYYATADTTCQTQGCRFNSGADNNGNLKQSSYWIPTNDQISSYNWTEDRYTYDSLNRLKSVTEFPGTPVGLGAQSFIQTYDYDRFGNRTINQSQTSTNVPRPNYTVAPSNNRLIAPAGYTYGYDAAGNQTSDNYTGQGARTYDAENRLKQAWANSQWQTYTYDASGHRIRRSVNGSETWQLYGMGGELLAEYQSGAAPYLPAIEYGYRNGELLTTITSGDTQRLSRFVTNLYYGALQRDPTPSELQDKINQLAAAGAQSQSQLLTTAAQIARSLFTLTNYETSPYRSDTQYVADLYYAYLQRGPDDSGLGWWAGQAAGSRVNVCNAFESSGEFQTLVSTLYGTSTSDNQRTEHFVNNFYLGAYGRNATGTELQQQRDALNTAAAQGLSQVQAQAETMGRALFAGQVNDAGVSNTQYVTNLYEGFLQRGPDAGGLGFWSGQASVGSGRQSVLNAFATCDGFRALAGTLYREANWLIADHLGTPRMMVNKSGSLASVKRHDYLPFGEELAAGTGGRTTAQGYSGDSVRQKFTGYERDNETGLDYAHARYFASTQGRFTGVDSVAGISTNPQTWNGYTYTVNNPLNLTDPTGLFANAEYGSDPSREMDPFLDYSRKRALWTEDIARALAAYQQMVDKGLANLKLKQQQKKEQQKKQEPQIVDAKKDKVIVQQTAQVKEKAKPLSPGEAPKLSSVKVIVGETYNVTDATYIDAYGNYTEHFTGTIRPIAYLPLDQGGNVIDTGIGVQEAIRVDGGRIELIPETGAAPAPQGGIFIDTQLIQTGQPTRNVQQAVFIGQISKETAKAPYFLVTGPNQITLDAKAGTITVTIGGLRRREAQ